VIGGVLQPPQDCRSKFPSLTDICADDVCFESAECALKECSTVADALDKLCRENDLRFHNKHLHGWGVVCGLQVVCGPNPAGTQRRYVTVKSGYAIACDGSDVLVNKDLQVDMINLLTLSPPSYTVQDGDYSLILDSMAPGSIRAVKYTPPKNPWVDALQHTLLADFYNDCIQTLINLVNQEFTSTAPGAGVITAGQQHVTAFINLLVQIINPDAGSFVFLSGDKAGPAQQEDLILRSFYNTLRQTLQSKTYCAMFENARQLPAYPYGSQNIKTIFGKGSKTRLRVDPTGARGYSLGTDDVIHVYDLKAATPNLALELAFPQTGVVVRDVAFSADGSQLYAVATQGPNTLFATAAVVGMTHTWLSTVNPINNVTITTLATRPSVAGTVYAIGAGTGLYALNPASVPPAPKPVHSCFAYGHLVIDDTDGIAYVTAMPANAAYFQNVRCINLANGDFYSVEFQFQGTWDDDIWTVSPAQGQQALYVVAGAKAQGDKRLLAFTPPSTGARLQLSAEIDLTENTPVRLAYNQVTRYLMLSFEDSYRVRLYKPGGKALETFRHPVQVSPLSIVYNDRAGQVYVLNTASNTINAIPAALMDTAKQMDLKALVAYRSGVINAYLDLLGGLLQYLKDCLCDHFLVDCPDCSDPKQDYNLYLAVVSMLGGQVQKVCNFEMRKQVHTFPKVEYWLSLVPIIPLVGKLVEIVCCAALPNFFAKFSAPQPPSSLITNPTDAGYTVRVPGETYRSTISYFQQTDFRTALTSQIGKLTQTRQFVTDFMRTTIPTWTPPPATPVKFTDVVGGSVDDAKTKLSNAQINVDSVVPYDPAQFGANTAAFAGAPQNLTPGSSVTLVADPQGVVRYYIPTAPSVGALRGDLQTGLQQVQQNTQAVNQIVAAGQQLQTRMDAAEKNLTAAQQLVQQNTDAVSQTSTLALGLQQRLTAAEANVTTTQQQLAQATATANQAKTDLATAQQGLSAVQTTLAQTATTANQVKTELAATEQSLSQTQQQVTQTAAVATQAKSDLSTLQQTVASTQPALTAAAALPAQIATLQKQLTDLQASHTQALAQVAQLQTQLKSVDDLKTQLGTLSTQVQKLGPKP
jgi:hypothetical protein